MFVDVLGVVMVFPVPMIAPFTGVSYHRIVAPAEGVAVNVPFPKPHRVTGIVDVTAGVEHSVLKVSSAVHTLLSVGPQLPRTQIQ